MVDNVLAFANEEGEWEGMSPEGRGREMSFEQTERRGKDEA